MIEEDTTATVKCPSCGTPAPVAALLCPGCGRPNVSSDFASTGTSSFAPPAEAAPPAEVIAAPAPPVELLPPPAPTARQTSTPAPAPVVAPSRATVSAAPAHLVWGPGTYPAAPPPGSAAEQLVNKIREIERQRARFVDENAEWTPGGTAPPTVKGAQQRLIVVLLMYALGLFQLLDLLIGASVFNGLMGLFFIVLATYTLFKVRAYYRRAIEYERADRQFVARRQEIIDQLRRVYGQDKYGPSPGEGTR